MKAKCPNCEAVYQIDDLRIPTQGARVKCPKCLTRFSLKKEPNPQKDTTQRAKITCPKCGHRQPKDVKCEKCGVIFDKFKAKAERQKPETKNRTGPQPKTEGKTKLANCKACGREISENANSCPHCGEPVKRKKIGCLGCLGVIVVLFFLGIIGSLIITSSDHRNSVPNTLNEDLRYEIINVSRMDGTKCSLDVMLGRKVSSDVLRALAISLRDAEPRRYQRMFICYYLPGMTPGTGAWATSHFSPDLKVEILGLTAEQERKLLPESEEDSNQIIGVWLDEMLGKTMIRRENDMIVMVQQFGDGSSRKLEMVETQESGQPRYKQKGENPFGEYYVIDRSENLRVYDREGLIKTLRPIR